MHALFIDEGISCIKVYYSLLKSFKMVENTWLELQICIILFFREIQMRVKPVIFSFQGYFAVFAFLSFILWGSSYQHMGLSGIKERVASLEGKCTFNSEKGKELEVIIYLPTTTFVEKKNRGGDDDDTYLVG